jgi:exopolyphosphatase/guanosine-5'-triphosphate,3'-diphosphate pyrophosphatase
MVGEIRRPHENIRVSKSMAQTAANAPQVPAADPGAAAPLRFPDARRMPRHTYGALDLGTNNCRLLIARPVEDGFVVVDAFSRVVRLGDGLAASGRISDAAIERALAALAICADKLSRRKVTLARSVATEACRRAVNGRHFVERVYRETGIVLDIIAPEEEARLAMLGCHRLLEPGDGPALIFDIGGGSTELVLVDTDGDEVPRIKSWWSAPWGVVSLTESEGRELKDEAERVAAFSRMRERVRHAFRRFAELLPKSKENIRLMGTSGTVTTLASVHLALPSYDRKAVDGLMMPERGDAGDQPDDVAHVAGRARRFALHRPRTRRPRRRRLRDPGRDHGYLAGQDARRRRSRHPRRHIALAHGQRRTPI